MFKYVLLFAFVACAAAAGGDELAEVKLLSSDVRPDGYDYALETSNGIHAVASGDAAGNVHGDFEWVSPEGEHVKVSYVADENGYQPQSNLLPVAPPVPEAIVRALKYIQDHPPKPEVVPYNH